MKNILLPDRKDTIEPFSDGRERGSDNPLGNWDSHGCTPNTPDVHKENDAPLPPTVPDKQDSSHRGNCLLVDRPYERARCVRGSAPDELTHE
jgi:hypothetical protein